MTHINRPSTPLPHALRIPAPNRNAGGVPHQAPTAPAQGTAGSSHQGVAPLALHHNTAPNPSGQSSSLNPPPVWERADPGPSAAPSRPSLRRQPGYDDLRAAAQGPRPPTPPLRPGNPIPANTEAFNAHPWDRAPFGPNPDASHANTPPPYQPPAPPTPPPPVYQAHNYGGYQQGIPMESPSPISPGSPPHSPHPPTAP